MKTTTKWTITVMNMSGYWDWEAVSDERTLFCGPTSAPFSRWGAKREAMKKIRALNPKPTKKPIKTAQTKTREYVVWQ